MPRRTYLIAMPVVAAVVATLGGPADGGWSPGSAGAGTALVGTAGVVSISGVATTASLYPTGAAAGDVSLRLTNPSGSSARVPRLALDVSQGTGGFAVDSGHTACTLSSLAYSTQTNGGAGWTVPAGGSLAVDLANAISLALTAPNACQGSSFTVFLTS